MLLRLLYQVLDIIFPIQFSSEDLKQISKSENVPIQDICAVLSYKDPKIKEIIRHFKRLPDRVLAKGCAEIMYKEIKPRLTEGSWELLPMPISKRRKRRRGFNQAELLAREIVKLDPRFVLNKKILYKKRDTKKAGFNIRQARAYK